MFDKQMYLARRVGLIERMNTGLVLLLGNESVGRNYRANTYNFRQDSTFLYYFGLQKAGLIGVVDIDAGRSHLFGDDADLDTIIWTGTQSSLHELAERVGVESSHSYAAIISFLKQAIQQGRSIHLLPPYRLQQEQCLSKWLNIPVHLVAAQASVALIRAVVAQRSIKSVEEVEAMEHAINISGVIHETLMQKAAVGMQEAQLAGIAKGTAVGMHGDLAYSPIVTVQGQILHNHHHHHILQDGQLVLVDAGAETAEGYAGDITRTFPVSGQFTAPQKAIYEIVLDAQMSVIRMLKPDIAYRDMHILAAARIVEGLKAIGLMRGDTNEAVAAGAHALFFPHGLGHHIGLDVHDMENLGEDYVGYDTHIRRSTQFGTAYLRLGKHLAAGNVITVEPGIYFIPELMDRWQQAAKFVEFINYDALTHYRGFSGIRIEDDVLITENGHRVLGKPIPKTIQEVETACQKR
ncbi:MAG: aminopeptidase P family protein [Bacteroidota bacterium]